MSDLLGDINEKLQEIIDHGEEVLVKAEDYIEASQAVNEAFERKNEDRNLHLDDLPLGEENIRVTEAAGSLDHHLAELRNVDMNSLTTLELAKLVDEAADGIKDAESTLEDVSPIPTDDVDD